MACRSASPKARFPVLAPCLLLLALLPLLASSCAPGLKSSAWLVRYDADSPAEIDALCAEAREAGFDQLLVQVRGRADAFYKSSLAPRPESLAAQPADFDPLARVLEKCVPLPVHAWLNVYYLWGDSAPPADPTHPGFPGHAWILSDNNGRSLSEYGEAEKRLAWVDGIFADPASAQYRQLFTRVVRELAENYAVSGIHLDFIRYPGPNFGKSGELGERFYIEQGYDPRYLPQAIERRELKAWLMGEQDEAERILTTAALFWSEMRAQEVSRLLRDLRAVLSETRPDMIVSAAVFPDAADAYLEKGQDWQGWAEEGLVDALYPMAYFGETFRVGNQLAAIAAAKNRLGQVELWAGLGAYIKPPAQIGAEAELAGKEGYTGASLFSLGHLARKNRGSKEYLQSLNRLPRLTSLRQEVRKQKREIKRVEEGDAALLLAIARKAIGEGLPEEKELSDLVAARLKEYRKAREELIPRALAQLAAQPVILPERASLHGIFRYIHPLDSPARKEEQQTLCEEARARLLAGEDFGSLAKELSQDGSKDLGGNLGNRFLDPLAAADQEIARLGPDEVSPVIAVENGCWCFRHNGVEAGREADFSEAPWEAKRILFRQALR
ncbi:family 10 glycosylhydrolase [Thiovibrio sp. JS02]